jgi:hypothetical protein
VLAHPVTKVKVATAHRILVSVNSFFIDLFGLIAVFVLNFGSQTLPRAGPDKFS